MGFLKNKISLFYALCFQPFSLNFNGIFTFEYLCDFTMKLKIFDTANLKTTSKTLL